MYKPLHIFLTFCLSVLCTYDVIGQDTFSIVAVDSVTGEVGSAGASCLDARVIALGAYVISDVIPGLGAIHTQSFYIAANQVNARNRLVNGDTPDQLMTWLSGMFNDAGNDPSVRQYGAASFGTNGEPLSASFTGNNCLAYAGQRVGKGYAIQGNILLGPEILDSMEARYLRATGPLADRLMACLQGANVPGADSRCLSEGVSSQSAFIRVAKPSDDPNNLYLDINVPQTPFGAEPIDSVQARFDRWKVLTSLEDRLRENVIVRRHRDARTLFVSLPDAQPYTLKLYDMMGKQLSAHTLSGGEHTLSAPGPDAVWVWRLTHATGVSVSGKVW